MNVLTDLAKAGCTVICQRLNGSQSIQKCILYVSYYIIKIFIYLFINLFILYYDKQ